MGPERRLRNYDVTLPSTQAKANRILLTSRRQTSKYDDNFSIGEDITLTFLRMRLNDFVGSRYDVRVWHSTT